MVNNTQDMKQTYDHQGYFVIRNYFNDAQITALREVILTFHNAWKQANERFYQEEAFNSSLITGSEYLNDDDRVSLFNFISSNKIMDIVNAVIPNHPAFMNTQLFFNPYNQQQENFWHRDCQYDHNLADQQKAIQETQVLHLRVPLFDEPGMELVPGSHKRWDSTEELDVRLARKRKFSSDALSTGKQIELAAGDLLVFSADMIHRGIYGLDRLAFDILVFDSAGDFVDYVDDDCLPNQQMLKEINNPSLFNNTLRLKALHLANHSDEVIV